VRYLAGAAGLAPLALAAAAPAHAATTTGAVGKTVTAAKAVRDVSAFGTAGSAAAAGHGLRVSGCTGSRNHSIPQQSPSADISGNFWSAPNGNKFCVGTIKASVLFKKTFSKNVTAKVVTNLTHHVLWIRTHTLAGTAGHVVPTEYSVHQSFTPTPANGGILVCLTSQYDGGLSACAALG
jgi:hypothetical protein